MEFKVEFFVDGQLQDETISKIGDTVDFTHHLNVPIEKHFSDIFNIPNMAIEIKKVVTVRISN